MANSDNTFFKKITKLFSNQAVVRVDDKGKRRVIDINDTQLTTNLSSLKDRYTKLQRSIYDKGMGAHSMAYHQVRRELFRDYDAMDADPILSSALDIYADECLGPDTVIPLLNGEKKTISDLYNEGYTDFWVYGLDTDGNFMPVKADKVAYNGKKKVKKIVLEDDTVIYATDNHIWVTGDLSTVETSKLKIGDGLYTLKTSISDYSSMKGYELIEKRDGDKIKIDSTNHKIKHISDDYIELDVYDLVNTGGNHIYAIETIDGGKLYTHNCTTFDEFGEILQIRSTNENVREILHNLFYDILNVEFNLWPWTRNLTKYGDFYLVLEISEGVGIVNVTPQSVYNTERLEGSDPNNSNYVKFKVENDPYGKGEYENFEIAHFRLLSDTNFLPYGRSMLEGGRRVWKQLILMEDAMLIHRIMRAPEKRIFKIDIGNIPPNEVDNYMQKIINTMKKIPFVDNRTGDYNLKYNMQNLTEDFFLPVRGSDSGTAIDNLGGLEYAAIDDIEYLRNKLFAALKIPKAYLSYDENVNGKSTLAAEDVRFARTIERVQRTLISELTKIAIVHLYSQNIKGADLVNFELSLTNPSTIYEQEKVNLWSEKVRLASDIKALNMLSNNWIYTNIFGMSEDDMSDEAVRIINDLKDRFRYNSIENDGNDPAEQKTPTDVESELDELKNEIKNKGGRPREGGTYGKDKHPYGRDPLGNKENEKPRKRDSIGTRSSNMAREVINTIKFPNKILTERLLDENNLIQ
jgi:hypothetical protein